MCINVLYSIHLFYNYCYYCLYSIYKSFFELELNIIYERITSKYKQ